MGVVETTAIEITCDNPNCPGNTLDPADRVGWTFISSEVYGQPTNQSVFCSIECVNAVTASTPNPLAPEPTVEVPAS